MPPRSHGRPVDPLRRRPDATAESRTASRPGQLNGRTPATSYSATDADEDRGPLLVVDAGTPERLDGGLALPPLEDVDPARVDQIR